MSDPGSSRGRQVIAPRGRGRRTAAERQLLLSNEAQRTRVQKEEDERAAAAQRVAAERAERQKQRNEQFRRRGRGGFLGDRQVVPSGPFAAGSIIDSMFCHLFIRDTVLTHAS